MAAKKQTIIIKKITLAKHGAHGGAWKVAYADFVTAMMAFFLVMWLMGSDEEIKASVAGYFNNPDVSPINFGISDPKGGSQVGAFQDESRPGGRPVDQPAGRIHANMTHDSQLIDIKEEIDESLTLQLGMSSHSANKVDVDYDSSGLVIKIIADDLFANHSSEIKNDLLPILFKIGGILNKNKNREIRVVGHTDPSEYPKEQSIESFQLSSARAVSVVRYWSQHFPELQERVSVAGSAHYRATPATTDQARGSNRSVDIIILNKKI